MSDPIYRLISISVQLSGLVYLIYRLGKYMGESTLMFKMIFQDYDDLKKVHAAHAIEDDERHSELSKDIVSLRVDIERRNGPRRGAEYRRGD
ncbi:MAG: hypothetical protein ACREJN_21405 [Nitrospiraceae bacterium]